MKTQKATRRKSRFQVCAYMPAGEVYPVLCVQILLPSYGAKFGQYLSPVVRRSDPGYQDLLTVAKGDIHWLYNTTPRPLL